MARHLLAILALVASACVTEDYRRGDTARPDDATDADGAACENDCAARYPTPPPCLIPVWSEASCTCSLVPRPDDAPCDDDNACTLEDRCQTGQCKGELVDLRAFCDDGDDCTVDNCDQLAGCVHEPADPGERCDDKNHCTLDARCDATGTCRWESQYVCGLCDPLDAAACAAENAAQPRCDGRLACRAGFCEVDPATVPDCADPRRDPCSPSACDPDTGACVAAPLADDTACSDRSSCTRDDRCQDGACVGTPVDAAECGCERDEDCAALDDGDLCNGVFTCRERRCVFDFESIVVCEAEADTPCQRNSCDPATGACALTPRNGGLDCDDGDPCTEGDVCEAGLCRGEALDCAGFSGTCLVGACDPVLGCVARPAEDGTSCTPTVACATGGACVGGACEPLGLGCDDGDPCTVDLCSERAGTCQHLGPERPVCAEEGVCAAGVPLRCERGEYRCAPEEVPGWRPVELCDGADDDCDGTTDVGCVSSDACLGGAQVASWGGRMQACAQDAHVGELACGVGWHPCSYGAMVTALGGDSPPPGYFIEASIAYEPQAGYAVVDRPGEGCFDFRGICTNAREVQAMTWDGVFGGTIAYAAEAWGCEGGTPAGGCGETTFAGVLCCQDECDADADCADGQECTTDACVAGRCRHVEAARPTCPSAGVCAGLRPTCQPDGSYACELGSNPDWEAVESRCDGLDNDCDGRVDALDLDFAEREPCERHLGACEGAIKPRALCSLGRWLPCTDATYAAHDASYEAGYEARCDGLDNDCDGAPDGGFAWQGRAVGETCDALGACGEGVVECDPTRGGATCSTGPLGSVSEAAAETCNGQDDDCDGATDEAEDLAPSAAGCPTLGVCAGAAPPSCHDGAWDCGLEALPGWDEVEHCDGVDNDCDGATDEGFVLLRDGGTLALGDACGVGACQGGVVVCRGDAAVCSADAEPDLELCDGRDNDCDGSTDETILYNDPYFGPVPLGQPCSAQGECAGGTVECGAALVTVCSTQAGGSASQVQPERCNGLDDDCDGATDEGYTYLGLALGTGCDGRGACGAGFVTCAGSQLSATCSTNPDGYASQARAETCNGQDDDCDGATDEQVSPQPGDCTFTGVCRPEVVEATCEGAAGWRCDFSASPFYQAHDEVGRCDGRDNDCDGVTDEDYPTLGASCDGADADQCARGVIACDPGDPGATRCAGDVAQAETCNGQDDDCDGATDEPGATGCTSYYTDVDGDGFGVGEPQCLCGPAGNVRATRAGDCADQAAARNPDAPEKCNGQDDDCDGKTDALDAADLLLDDPRPCEQQQGVCQGAQKPALRCQDGAWQACQAGDYLARSGDYQSPKETRCDGKDNDCDGTTDGADGDVAAARPPCELQGGVCQGAMKPVSLCGAAGWGSCQTTHYLAWSSAYEPGDEQSCDGKDNECDGLVDDPFLWGGKKVGQSCDGTGSCGLGVVECRADELAATCSTNPDGSASQAGLEACNGQDDDCDGQTDDGLGVAQSTCKKVGVCRPELVAASCAQGVWLCDYAAVPGYEGQAEASCDALDNDCDGPTDEDFTLAWGGQTLRKGDACGSGQCLGAVVCHDATSPPGDLVCSSELAGQGEVCDRADNDCDGQTDEGLAWTPPTPPGSAPIPVGQLCNGVGECGNGVVECGAQMVATCSTNPNGSQSQATAEVCNGKDDDCDGQTDEGFAWAGIAVGQACDGTGRCGVGVVECRGGGTFATCSTNPNGSQSQATPEVCNGQDDDCDAASDEGLTVLDSTCALLGQCTPQSVTATCLGVSGWACDYSKVPGYHAGDELGYCDALDNDCDGQTDEDYPQLGTACDGDDADLCALGTWACLGETTPLPFSSVVILPIGSEPICSGDVARIETCAAGDEDCDGQVNEPGASGCTVYFKDGDGDGWGDHADARCLCAPDPLNRYTSTSALSDCDDDNVEVHPQADEVCNEADDDCDGTADEEDAAGCELYWSDADKDTWGQDGSERCFCSGKQAELEGLTATRGGDCDDKADAIHPEADELCDELDNDCDGKRDDEDPYPADCTLYYQDGDGDTWGQTASFDCRCKPSEKFTASRGGDCCDGDARARPGQLAFYPQLNNCSSFDYDCSGGDDYEHPDFGACDCGISANLCTAACTTRLGWSLRTTGGLSQSIPKCGVQAAFISSCSTSQGGLSCTPNLQNRQQRCH